MADVPEPEPTAAPSPGDVERRIVSVLFADLVGFTPLSERLDAEDVATIQDAYFEATRTTIARYAGVVEKFIGDAVMAVFGTPRSREDDADRAVRAGLALVNAVEQLNARLGLEPDALQLRVGVNTGEVVHATSGADAGRVTGDTVNTAARLQTAARPGTVLIGELTALTVADAIETVAAGEVELKGKAAPVRTWEATGIRPAPSREEALGSLRAPTLGRQNELARLHDAIGRAAHEARAQRTLVIAPPGVGKSRLLAELAETSSTDALVRRARVRPQGTAPYETVAQLFSGVEIGDLREALAAGGVTTIRIEVVAEQVGRLREPATEARAASGDLATEREARFEAWTTALDAVSERVELWLIEDVHWAGPDLLAFLDHAGQAPTGHGRVVVATARPSLLETAPDWCETDRIDLAPLPGTDAAALVRALVGDALPDRLVDAVVARSDGTPLFIEELLRTWASVGILVPHRAGVWGLAVEPETVVLPQTVQAIYAAQLDDLPADARLVARRGAVAGRRVPLGALPALDLPDGHSGVAVLRRRDFLAGPLHDDLTGDAYAYRHALLRDAGYASLARVERTRLHLAMAAWLEEVAGERADVVAEAIAEHVAQALDSLPALAPGDLPPRADLARSAAAWYERAARSAVSLAAHEAARRLLERAIELTDPDAPLEQARRRLELGTVLAQSADLDAGIGHLEAALEALGEHLPQAAPGFAAAAHALGGAYMQQIRFPEAGEVAARGLDALDTAGAEEPIERSRLLVLHAWARSARGIHDGVIDEAVRAEQLAATTGDPGLELEVLERATAVRSEVGVWDPHAWDEVARRATELLHWQQALVAMRFQAMERGDTDLPAALAVTDAASELARAHGLTEQAGWAELARCETHFVAGDWDPALEAGLRALELAERYAYIRLGFRTWMVMLPILAARRDPTHIERHDRWRSETIGYFPSTPSPYGAYLTGALGVWRARALGEEPPMPDESLAALDIGFANPHFRAAIETVAQAWISAGHLAPVRILAAKPIDDDATLLMRSSDALLDAWLAAATDGVDADAAAAHAHARRAAAHARELGATWWLARALRLLDDPEADALDRRLGI